MPVKPPIAKESATLKACLNWLDKQGLDPIRNNSGALKIDNRFIRMGKKGSGDILVCGRGGRWIEIECKRQGKKQELHQKVRQQHVERMGGLYILAYSVDDLEAHKGEILA
jgi:hypothetical protein